MKKTSKRVLGAAVKSILGERQKRLLDKLFGPSWRATLLGASSFGPVISAMQNETVVLGGCYLFETVRTFHKVVGPGGRIVAIEANPDHVERLRQELARDAELSKASNIDLVAKGIWDKKGTATFIKNAGDYPGFDKMASDKLREFPFWKVNGTSSIEIEVDSLDNILSDLGITHVDYVVLTINDAELVALDGIDQLMANNPQVRFMINSNCPQPCQQVKQKLIDKGYKVYAAPIVHTGLERIYAFIPASGTAKVPATHSVGSVDA